MLYLRGAFKKKSLTFVKLAGGGVRGGFVNNKKIRLLKCNIRLLFITDCGILKVT